MVIFDLFTAKRNKIKINGVEVDLRSRAEDALEDPGNPEVEALLIALDSRDWVVRACAAMGLGEIGDKKSVEPLIQALSDRNKSVRAAAAVGLSRIGDRRAIEPLIRAFNDKDILVRKFASEALVEIRYRDSLETVYPPNIGLAGGKFM